MAIESLFIANRGEIAVRIIKAAKELGIRTIQAYSEADRDMLAVRLADEAMCVGAPAAANSYLNIKNIISAARASKADAVHPGYGFLAESPIFAAEVVKHGMVFIGPSAETIASMGDKIAAREAAERAGVPIVPGSKGRIDGVDQAVEIARRVGYPVMIKAAAGGGGRGIRIANNDTELRNLAPQAQAEAQAAFGDGGLYLERAVRSPRHIEVQIIGDGENVVHFYERECSLQRRRQKVWEEAGAACLDEQTREKLCRSAVNLARTVNYRGAGTLEYLYDETSKEFFFIEMNTRIQVEHPVTEMLTGFDLVQEMIRVCDNHGLSVTQDQISRHGHAIEVRINAEDPLMQFMPFPGQITGLSMPEGEGVRFDHFLYEGYSIPPFYDSLLGKLIVHGDDRAQALAKLHKALQELKIDGLKTTIPLHLALGKNPDVLAGKFHTQWLEPWLETGNLN